MTTSPHPPAVDAATYQELSDTAGAEFASELADTFMQEAPLILAELRSALEAGHADRFRRAAHSLKSNASTFGAGALAEAARKLELSGLPADDAPLLALAAELALVAAALQQLQQGLSDG